MFFMPPSPPHYYKDKDSFEIAKTKPHSYEDNDRNKASFLQDNDSSYNLQTGLCFGGRDQSKFHFIAYQRPTLDTGGNNKNNTSTYPVAGD